MGTTVRVAAIQMESRDGQIEANLRNAASLVNHAAQKGAEFVLLPEFMPTGSVLSTEIWKVGEPREGPTVRWLKETSKRLGIWLGTSFLEADGTDFFNTFALTDPDGKVAGWVRKYKSGSFEAFFFRGDTGSHVIDTELGKMGVGICYDNYLTRFLQTVKSESVDMVIMPQANVDAYTKVGKEMALLYARLLGVPAVMSNKCGAVRGALPVFSFMKAQFNYPGLSTIADSDGTIKAQLGIEEGVIVEDVTLDSCRKTHCAVKRRGRWAFEMPLWWNLNILVETLGMMSYALSSQRKRKARLISSPGNPQLV